MRRRSTLLLLATLFAGATLAFAADPSVGTWKLDEAKSKISPGDPKNTTVKYEMAGDSLKATLDGVDGKGMATHSEWTGKFDGKDYPTTGDPSTDTRAIKKINDHTLEITNKKGGKVTVTGKIVLAADGKSRTLTVHRTGADGKKVEDVFFYEKQ